MGEGSEWVRALVLAILPEPWSFNSSRIFECTVVSAIARGCLGMAQQWELPIASLLDWC